MVSPEIVASMTDEEFANQTCDLISREFGLGGLARHIASRPGQGNYTAAKYLRPQPTMEELLVDLAQQREHLRAGEEAVS